MAAISLITLGGWGVTAGDARDGARESAPSKNLALLVYLACSPGFTARRETLIDMLWSDKEPDAADHALRQTVLQLRAKLGPDAVVSTPGRLSLANTVSTDRARFLSAIDAQDYIAAIAAYHGDFLPGFAAPGGSEFEKWADLERRRLQGLFLLACDNVARDLLAKGQFRDAVAAARRARDADLHNESSARLLIECLLASGDAVSAHVEAQVVSQALSNDGRTPEPATAVMIRRALEIDALARPGGSAFTTEFVGRERQFVEIWECWTASKRGLGHHIHAIGAPGIGKSRLLQEIAARIGSSGGRLVSVRANSGERTLRFALAAELAAALGGLSGASGVSPGTARTLVALNPGLTVQYPDAAPAVISRSDAARVMALALSELLECVADDGAVAVVVDDLHWADPESQALMQSLVDRSVGTNALILTSARPGASGQVQRASTIRIDLPPFDQSHVGQLMSGIATLPPDGWALDLPVAMHRYAQGSPLLVIEVLRLAMHRDLLAIADGIWTSANPVQLFALLAEGGALRHRVADLSAAQRHTLVVLSAAGVPLALELIAKVTRKSEGSVAADLHILEAAGLVLQQQSGWSPAHDAIAERVMEDCAEDERRSAVEALGDLLAITGAGSDMVRAVQHFGRVGADEKIRWALARWVRDVRSAGDRRSTRELVSEALGVGATSADITRHAKRLPLSVRYAPHWQRVAVVGGAAAFVALAVAALTPSRTVNHPLVVGVWAADATGRSRLSVSGVSPREIDRHQFDTTGLKAMPVQAYGWSDGVPRPGNWQQWAITRSFPDSGGVEVVLGDANNGERRLTFQRGDDYTGAWSPDGRLLAIATDRWSNSSRASIAILDPDHPEGLRRLTNEPGARDVVPSWSPDGTLIAFVRQTYTARSNNARPCIVTVNGRHQRCFELPRRGQGSPIGWSANGELLADVTDSAGDNAVVAINVSSGAPRVLAAGQSLGASHARSWFVCECRRMSAEPYQTLIMSADDTAAVMRIPHAGVPPKVNLFSTAADDRYVDRVEILPVGRISMSSDHQLRSQAFDAAGRLVEPSVLLWEVADTSAAAISDGGLLRPKRPGSVTVVVTAGGWRSDSATIVVEPPPIREELTESWKDGLSRMWFAFGTPHPTVAKTASGWALAPNGDSTHQSGVLSTWRLSPARGVGVEFTASVPLSQDQWQNLSVDLVRSESLDLKGWSPRVGDVPSERYEWRSCGMFFPTSLGGESGRHVSLASGLRSHARVDQSVGKGAWTRFRIQYFADGSCGLAVNGRAVAFVSRPVALGDSVGLHISAYSHRTRVLVGPVTVWTGVREGVDWSKVR